MLNPELCGERHSWTRGRRIRIRVAPGDEEETLRRERDARVIDSRYVGCGHPSIGDSLSERERGSVDRGSQRWVVGVRVSGGYAHAGEGCKAGHGTVDDKDLAGFERRWGVNFRNKK